MKNKLSTLPAIKIVLIIITVCIALFPLIWCIVGIFVIGHEDNADKKELNNPIINADYRGWHTVTLINEETVMLPEEWSIINTESITIITDKNNKEVAKGSILKWDDYMSNQYDESLSKLLDFPVSVDAITQTKNVRSSVYGTIILSGNNSTEYDYILLFKSSSYPMIFVFEPIPTETRSNLTDMLEAMVFSYVWK